MYPQPPELSSRRSGLHPLPLPPFTSAARCPRVLVPLIHWHCFRSLYERYYFSVQPSLFKPHPTWSKPNSDVPALTGFSSCLWSKKYCLLTHQPWHCPLFLFHFLDGFLLNQLYLPPSLSMEFVPPNSTVTLWVRPLMICHLDYYSDSLKCFRACLSTCVVTWVTFF